MRKWGIYIRLKNNGIEKQDVRAILGTAVGFVELRKLLLFSAQEYMIYCELDRYETLQEF